MASGKTKRGMGVEEERGGGGRGGRDGEVGLKKDRGGRWR